VHRNGDPIDNPELPSYRHPTLRQRANDLTLVRDCWDGLPPDRLSTYLPKEPAEPDEAYKGRLGRTRFVPFLRDAITAFAGILGRYELAEPPATFEIYDDNVDRLGNDHRTFFAGVDARVLRDGGCLVVVDMPDGEARNRAEEVAQARRPFLTRYDREDVGIWRVRYEGDQEVPELVVLREWAEVRDGMFGTTHEARYRILEGANWRVVKIEREQGKEPRMVPVLGADGQAMEGTYKRADGRPFAFPPVVWCPGSTGAAFGEGDMPLLEMARLNIEHLQKRSDQAELSHKLAMPVPWVKGRVPRRTTYANGTTVDEPLTLGPNSFVELGENGAFGFGSPDPGSLAHRQDEIRDIERLIQDQALAFAYGGGATKTAMQAGLEAARTQAKIADMGRAKANYVNKVFTLWAAFTGEELSEGAGITMAQGVFDRPMEAADERELRESIGLLYSQRSAVTMAIKGGRNTAGTSAEAELQQMEEEARAAQGEVPGVNNLGGNSGLPSSADQLQAAQDGTPNGQDAGDLLDAMTSN
jgi:hypothetical protein